MKRIKLLCKCPDNCRFYTPQDIRVVDSATGEDIEGVTSVKFAFDVHSLPILTLEVLCPDLELEAFADPQHTIPDPSPDHPGIDSRTT